MAAWLCLTLCDPMDCISASLLCPWVSLGKNTGVICHFLLHIPFYGWIIKGYTTLFFIHSSVDGYWYCSSFWLLWIVLVWRFMCKVLFKCLFSFWGSKYLGMELLGHILSLTFWGKGSSSILKLLHHSLCPPATYKGSNFSMCLSTFVIFLFLKKLL